MTTASEPSLLDSNVLVYAYYKQAPQYAACRALLEQAQTPDAGLCVSPQNLAEFYAIVTNPRRVTQPRTTAEALVLVAELLALPGLSLLSIPADVVDRWSDLVRQHPLTGSKVYDAQIVATMFGNGVTRIYTHNAADFRRFNGIKVITP